MLDSPIDPLGPIGAELCVHGPKGGTVDTPLFWRGVRGPGRFLEAQRNQWNDESNCDDGACNNAQK